MKKNSGKWFRRAFVFMLCLTLTGCGPSWKKKFVRKRADNKPDQVFVYEPQEYQREPNSELYKRSFIFWKAWQEELANRLGNNKAADVRAFEEALKNLEEMQECLSEQKAGELGECKKKIADSYNAYKSGDYSIVESHHMRDDLNKLMLKMDKQFRYNRVKEFIK